MYPLSIAAQPVQKQCALMSFSYFNAEISSVGAALPPPACGPRDGETDAFVEEDILLLVQRGAKMQVIRFGIV